MPYYKDVVGVHKQYVLVPAKAAAILATGSVVIYVKDSAYTSLRAQ